MRRSHRAGSHVIGSAAFAATISACSLLTPLGGLSTGEDPISPEDAAPTGDASVASDATNAPDVSIDVDATVDAATRPNLHKNGTFETGCDFWGAYRSTLASESAYARSGAKSCRVCSDGSTFYSIDDGGHVDNPPVGSVFYAAMWVRKAPGYPVATKAFIMLRTFDNPPWKERDIVQSPHITLTDAWQRLEATLVVTQGQYVNVVGAGADGGCFLIDDVVLERVE
ncbi:MAG: hypothetical protein KF819_06910 [Labilithrix sp.]|nr:hypothetical protein [Labilithrix sp.]